MKRSNRHRRTAAVRIREEIKPLTPAEVEAQNKRMAEANRLFLLRAKIRQPL